MEDRHLIEFASRNGGVVTADILGEAGLTDKAIRSRRRRFGWESVGRGAYRLLPIRDNIDAVRAAVAVLPRAFVSHETAAELHGMTRLPTGRAVVTVHSRTTHEFEAVEVRRCHDLDDSHTTVQQGLPMTTVERTIVDLAAGRHPKHVGAIVDDLHVQGLVDFDLLAEVAGAIARKGKPGTVAMRRVLEERVGSVRRQSVLERRGRRLLRDAGLFPASEFPIPWAPHRRFDDAFPLERIAVEWDSLRFHGRMDSFEADRRRDRESAIHGWVVLRFTWNDVEQRPAEVVETVRRLVVQRASAG